MKSWKDLKKRIMSEEELEEHNKSINKMLKEIDKENEGKYLHTFFDRTDKFRPVLNDNAPDWLKDVIRKFSEESKFTTYSFDNCNWLERVAYESCILIDGVYGLPDFEPMIEILNTFSYGPKEYLYWALEWSGSNLYYSARHKLSLEISEILKEDQSFNEHEIFLQAQRAYNDLDLEKWHIYSLIFQNALGIIYNKINYTYIEQTTNKGNNEKES